MSERGRPTEDIYLKYVSGKEDVITAFCRNGADNAKLAELLGCGKTTVSKLLKRYPQFKQLVRENKKIADLKMEASLYKSGMGYEIEETTTEVRVNPDGSGTTTYVKKVKKHVQPDTTAQIFWLKNRQPEAWKDKQVIDGELTINPFAELMRKVAERKKNQE